MELIFKKLMKKVYEKKIEMYQILETYWKQFTSLVQDFHFDVITVNYASIKHGRDKTRSANNNMNPTWQNIFPPIYACIFTSR